MSTKHPHTGILVTVMCVMLTRATHLVIAQVYRVLVPIVTVLVPIVTVSMVTVPIVTVPIATVPMVTMMSHPMLHNRDVSP